MTQIQVKYENQEEYGRIIEKFKLLGKIKSISTPQKVDKWYKIWIKIVM